jgi:ribosome maturation factor RimP
VELTEEWFQQVIGREVEGAELVLLEEAGNRRQKILRLYIDHPAGVNHDLCARVSVAVGDALDFEAQIGNKVYVKTRLPIEGSKVWQGLLMESSEDSVVVEEAGRLARIPFEEITSAHVIFEFR